MATLKVTIKEELVLNGKDVGNDNYISIAGVNNAEHKIIDVGTGEQSLLLFDTAIAAGTYADNTVKHLRLTNLDDTNFIQLRLVGGTTQYYAKLEPKETFILGNSKLYADATGTSATEAFINIDSMHVKADTAACELEVFIATS